MASNKHKIGIVSFENPFDEGKFRPNRLKSLKKISIEARKKGLTHLFFSGSTIDYRYSKDIENDIKNDIKFMSKEFDFLSIFFELTVFYRKEKPKKWGLYCFEKGKNLTINPIKQIFVTSRDDEEKYSELWSDTVNGSRTFSVDGINVLVWICGEINYLKNAQSDNNKVTGARYTFRPNIAPNKLDYDIFFNPTHDPLKALIGKYKERLKYMSQHKKVSILNFNVDENQIQRKGTIYCFQDGKEILTKDMKTDWEDHMYHMEVVQI